MSLNMSLSTPEAWAVVPAARKGILYVRNDNAAVRFHLSTEPLHCPFGASKYDAAAPGKHTLELDLVDLESFQRLDTWARSVAEEHFPKTDYHSFLKESRLRCKADLETARFWVDGRCVDTPELRGRGVRAVAVPTMWSTAGRSGLSLTLIDLCVSEPVAVCPFGGVVDASPFSGEAHRLG